MAVESNRDFEREVLGRVSEGESLSSVCRDLKEAGCPSKGWFLAKVLDDKEFADRYARARRMQCEVWADEIRERSSNSRLGTKTEEGPEGMKITTGDAVDRARLEVDALKWLLAKLHPRQYGDKVTQEIQGKDGAPVAFQWLPPTPPPSA